MGIENLNRRGMRAARSNRRRVLRKTSGDSNPAKRFPLGHVNAIGTALSHRQRRTASLRASVAA